MREIKFRAWYKNEMVEVMGLDWHYDDFNFARNEKDKEWATLPRGILSKAELMQYTGLKDNQGREIYEGDVIHIFETWDDDTDYYPDKYQEFNAVIEFYNGAFWYKGIDMNRTDCNWHFYDDIEVIGNIYENPEILKGETND